MRNSAGRSSQYKFSIVPDANIPRCRLKRPFGHKTTINAGLLYPLFVDEYVPGDTFKLNVSTLARLTTLLVPLMDNIYMDWQFFAVPNRLVWDNFEKMMGAKDNPSDTIDYVTPRLIAPENGIAAKSLSDYMGLPLGVQWRDGDVNALPWRCYNLIWNEWYRDGNIQDSVTVKLDDTDDAASDYVLLPRGKRKDYFTSALPEPQRGDPVILPLGSTAPVTGNGLALGLTDGTVNAGLMSSAISESAVLESRGELYGKAYGTLYTGADTSAPGYLNAVGVTKDPAKSGLVADLANAQGVSINAVRQAFQLQRLLERDARGGCNRYTEILRAHFNVQSPDARLQRPEFLGSFTVPVNIHSVAQTSAGIEGGTPQGNLAGVGVASGVYRAFTKSFVEHGWIIGLCSIRAELNYQQGIPRMYSRRGRYDFYWPALAHLGEQGILNKEIYAQGTSKDGDVFGYQERWSEYKFGFNRISGDFRSTASHSLDVWHLAQEFSALPTLNATFIKEDPPLDRCLAVSSDNAPQFFVDTVFDLECVRPFPLYDIPGFVDHF